MIKLLFFIFLSLITNLVYSKEVNLWCTGTYDYISTSYLRVIDFTFNDTKESVNTDENLLCFSNKGLRSVGLKSIGREFSKKRIYSSSETGGKSINDVGYCSHSYELNRHSGKLITTRVENFQGVIITQGGSFNCELAKQKF